MNRRELAARIVSERWSEVEAGVRILWLFDRVEGTTSVAPGAVADFLVAESISQPNRSRLSKHLAADRRVLRDNSTGELKLRAAALAKLDEEMGYLAVLGPATPLVASLQAHAAQITGPQTRAFVEESIVCMKAKAPRAAIVMSWCGAMSVLQEFVFQNHLADFNADAVANSLLKKHASSIADMRDISKECQFIESRGRISIIDGSTKRLLKRCLDRRNEIGHPTEVRISEASVADHIDSLILNVFQKFGAH